MKAKILRKIAFVFALAVFANVIYGQTNEVVDRKSYFTKSYISETDKIKVFDNFWQTVNDLYFDETFNGVDWRKLREIYQPQAVSAKNKFELSKILNKMLGELKISHMRVSFEVGISGKTLEKFFGSDIDYKKNDILFDYGFSTRKLDGQQVVTEVVKNSGAEETGLKPGWIMKTCEYNPLARSSGEDLLLTEEADCIFIDENQNDKKLVFYQSWFLKPRSSTQRTGRLIDDKILFLKFDMFDNGTGKWMKQELADNAASGTVVIDLRGNAGGRVDELKEALSLFFPAQTAAGHFIERDLDEKMLRIGSDNYYKGRVIVLIDDRSKSAAEIFAATIQEAKRGQIIGQKSGGEVLNSIVKSLSGGFKLQIAFRDYRTAKDIRLEGKGVTPDIEIPLTLQDFRRQKDIVLEKTLEILRK